MERISIVGLFVLLVANALVAQGPSVATLPPVVVKTVPESGDVGVDPTLGEIRVTFSKDMMTNDMWSWVMASEATFPKTQGKSHYLADKRTCVLPVKLDPGKTYVIWINSEAHNAFRDLGNRPAVPYLLVFQTRQ